MFKEVAMSSEKEYEHEVQEESKNENDIEQATALAEELLLKVDEGPREASTRHYQIRIADVEAAIDRFSFQFRYCIDYGLPFPCLQTADDLNALPIPVDWASFIPLWLQTPYFHLLHDFPYLIDRFGQDEGWFQTKRFRASVHDPIEVKGFIKNRLTQFLTPRFRAYKPPEPSTTAFTGLRFQVNTAKHGLRVHYSPAYFYDPTNVFGSPTSPVVEWIQPGRYLFGVIDHGELMPRFDPAEFDIPTHTHAQLVI
jgi:hypothetical protein